MKSQYLAQILLIVFVFSISCSDELENSESLVVSPTNQTSCDIAENTWFYFSEPSCSYAIGAEPTVGPYCSLPGSYRNVGDEVQISWSVSALSCASNEVNNARYDLNLYKGSNKVHTLRSNVQSSGSANIVVPNLPVDERGIALTVKLEPVSGTFSFDETHTFGIKAYSANNNVSAVYQDKDLNFEELIERNSFWVEWDQTTFWGPVTIYLKDWQGNTLRTWSNIENLGHASKASDGSNLRFPSVSRGYLPAYIRIVDFRGVVGRNSPTFNIEND